MSKIVKSGLGKRNYIILLIGVLLVTIGYFVMNTGERTISPIILIIAYVIVIPISLILPAKNNNE